MTTEPANVAPPKHPLHALTTFELRDYRRKLENAIAFIDQKDPAPSARGGLQARLAEVIIEQEDRERPGGVGQQPDGDLRLQRVCRFNGSVALSVVTVRSLSRGGCGGGGG